MEKLNKADSENATDNDTEQSVEKLPESQGKNEGQSFVSHGMGSGISFF